MDYYRARAEQELERARSATAPEAARAHYELAGLYLNRVHDPEAAAPRVAEPAGQAPAGQ